MDIEKYTKTDYSELIQVWEASVRSTHFFLTEADIQFFKSSIEQQYFPAVTLYVIRNETNRIVAFMGLSDTLIEMLFVHPEEQGKGYGKRFIEFAVCKKHIRKVDVNEQNEKAHRFYLQRGFKVISRNETDGMGKPFPILHMKLETPRRIRREQRTIEQMIHLYCRHKEGNKKLCSSCKGLLEYAHTRLEHCPFGEKKSTCRRCPVHCYKPELRKRMQTVMRYAGPRMILYHPIAAIRHLLQK